MWQDYWFAFSGLVFTVVLLPSCFDPKTEIPRFTSGLTFMTLVGSGFVHSTLGMGAAASMMWLSASPWAFIYFFRPIR